MTRCALRGLMQEVDAPLHTWHSLHLLTSAGVHHCRLQATLAAAEAGRQFDLGNLRSPGEHILLEMGCTLLSQVRPFDCCLPALLEGPAFSTSRLPCGVEPVLYCSCAARSGPPFGPAIHFRPPAGRAGARARPPAADRPAAVLPAAAPHQRRCSGEQPPAFGSGGSRATALLSARPGSGGEGRPARVCLGAAGQA